MAERGALEGQCAAVGSNEPCALTALDLADLADRDVGSPGGGLEASGFGRRHSADDLVATTALAASESGTRATSTSAATPETRHSLPKSPARPSEMSIAAEAWIRTASASALRGCGTRYRERRCWRCGSSNFQRLPLRIITPSAASPIVPVTKTRSPALAPARRTIVPSGTVPNMAMETTIGPGVRSVSPPNSGQPNRSASARKPCAKPSSHCSPISRGRASDKRNPSGRAPFAARSDKFTRNALPATVSAASSGKKCTPPTIASVVSTRSNPAGGVRKAASSDKPRAPGCVASGLKKRAIRRSSGDMSSCGAIVSPGGAAEFACTHTPRELVEHGVDHAGLVALDKGGHDVGIFGHHDPRGHVGPVDQLIGASPQR